MVGPRENQGWLNNWRQRVKTDGRRWKVLNNMERLEELLGI